MQRNLIYQIKDRWTQRSASQNEMTLVLAVIAILLLLGLLCCVVLAVFLFRRGFIRRSFGGFHGALEFTYARFHLIDEANVFVVPDDASLRVVVRVPNGRGPQADGAQVGGFHAEYAQGYRQREERHAERHGESRLPDRAPDGLHRPRGPGLHTFPASADPRNPWLRRQHVHPQALGVNARCGCQNIVDQTDWRLHLREILQPVAARRDFGEQRPARGTSPGVGLEGIELSASQNAVERVTEEAIELLTLHSVIGGIRHHITCL